MTTFALRLVSCACAALLLPACAATTPHWDQHFGEAVRASVTAQLVAPAAANPDPVQGIDGRAAAASQERYERSFAQPPAAAPVMVNSR